MQYWKENIEYIIEYLSFFGFAQLLNFMKMKCFMMFYEGDEMSATVENPFI